MEELLPARPAVTRSPIRTVRLLNLQGVLDHPVECKSALERDFVYRAALCPSVGSLRHQPFRLKLASGRTYVPDFLVCHHGACGTVVEVMRDAKHNEHNYLFEEVDEQLKGQGLNFAVIGEGSIRRKTAHERAALVLRYRKAGPTSNVANAVVRLFDGHRGGMPIGGIQARSGLLTHDLYHLIAIRVLATSPSIPLSQSAHVFLASHFKEPYEIRIEDWLDVAPWRAKARSRSTATGRGDAARGCPDAQTDRPEAKRAVETDLDGTLLR